MEENKYPFEIKLSKILPLRKTEHFNIYYYPESFAEKQIEAIAEQREKAYDEISDFFNALIKMNISNWEPEFIGSFPGELDYDRKRNFSLYQRPAEKDGILYFPPLLAKEIASYNTKDNKFTKIPYDKKLSHPDICVDFNEAVIYKNYVFFVPAWYSAIIRLDTDTHEVTYHSDWVSQIRSRAGYIEDSYFVCATVIGNIMMLATCGTNAVIEFNMETCEATIHDVGKKGYRYNGICFDGENYWLSPRSNTPIIRWNHESGETKEFTDIHFEITDKQPFVPCFYKSGYVWLIPMWAQHALKIDALTEAVSIVKEFEFCDSDDKEQDKLKYIFAKVYNDSIFALRVEGGIMIEYNCETNKCREEILSYPPETASRIESLTVKRMLIKPEDMDTTYKGIYFDHTLNRLKDFINYIVLYSDTNEEEEMSAKRIELAGLHNARTDGMSGSVIYKHVVSAIMG